MYMYASRYVLHHECMHEHMQVVKHKRVSMYILWTWSHWSDKSATSHLSQPIYVIVNLKILN